MGIIVSVRLSRIPPVSKALMCFAFFFRADLRIMYNMVNFSFRG